MKMFTIGFTKKNARMFFEELQRSGAKRIVDVRLNNVSQLAGFAKQQDLKYFLEEICDMGYVHFPELAPTKDILDAYKKHNGDWGEYEKRFVDLMSKRRIEDSVPRDVVADGCLLCSEDRPHHCHRRLVAEYLREHWGEIDIVHLG